VTVSPLAIAIPEGQGSNVDGLSEYDVIVVGSGHAGCEAALAAARMGCKTAVFTLNLDNVALMPCNPSVGGPGKGHLVREIDALGGEMAKNTDRTSVQIRMLNTSKGPAVQALRAQSDKRAYSQSMKFVLEDEHNLDLKQAVVDDLLIAHEAHGVRVAGVVTSLGTQYGARTVVLTTGTFLKGRIIVGDESYPAGRAGEFPADNLSSSLARCGFRLGRLKTGTPPRVDGRTIDYRLAEPQPGSEKPLFFSLDAREAYRAGHMAAPSRLCPIAPLAGPAWTGGGSWRDQLKCHAVQTSEQTHQIIRENLHRAPMYNGGITSAGPRYCPSIETKIVRFADKPTHNLFLEPEGWQTREVYVQGANTSLPEDVQLAMLRTIPALRHAEIMRAGYAIEYDYLPGTQVFPWLEAKLLRNLFMAGQIIGTTGYEEAAALGIMAGINAARRAADREPVVLRRDQAYIGVLVDDLVTKEMDEPYRMHTSQAEFRLLLRQDNAESRLSGLAREIGTIADERYDLVTRRATQVNGIVADIERSCIAPTPENNQVLSDLGRETIARPVRARDFLCRGSARISDLQALGLVPVDVPDEVAQEAETVVKYAGYVQRQEEEVQRLRRLEDRVIPVGVDYAGMAGMRSESRERLARVRPRTVGQAARVAGVAPSDISVLLVHLERERRSAAAS
jgi:tRNA uridine 5-carboxymethylaminomethyl modification enzyme